MELVFQDSRMEYLDRILCETIGQEQTAELIVPDRVPDAARVVDAFGTVLVRSEECTATTVSVAGEVQAGVLFVSEDGQVHRLSAQIPFSVRREFAGQQDNCTLQCQCSLKSADGRLLNSRKILLRVGILCTLQVFAETEQTLCDISEPSPTLQLKRKELPLKMPLSLGEKSFVLNEELPLPPGKPAISNLLKCLLRTQTAEQKVVGNKAVFKGELCVHALYEDTDGTLQSFDEKLPFSQYAELDTEREDCELKTLLTLTSAEVEPESASDCRRLLLSVHLLAQCAAYGEQKVSYIEDAYCTDAELVPAWAQWRMYGVLDRQVFRETAAATAQISAQRVVDAWLYPEELIRRREGDRLQMELPLGCNVLYYDTDGALQGKTVRLSAVMDTALSPDGGCDAGNIGCGEIYCAANSDGIEVRCPVSIETEFFANEMLKAVSGAEIRESEHDGHRRPAVLLRRTEEAQDVWEIAKSCRAPVEEVALANDLQSQTVPAGTMLLIPMR